MSIRVLLVDDHTIVRQGIAALLEKENDITIIGQAQTGLDALKQVGQLLPDVLVLDIALPDLSGLEIAHQVSHQFRQIRIVILSMHEDVAYAAEAQRKGAKGYVVKDSGVEHLLQAIHLVMLNQTYLSPPLNQELVDEYRRRTLTGQLDPIDTLTPTERIIFHLIINGHSSRQIADEMNNSIRTIDTHRANILRKFKATSTIELIRYSIDQNITKIRESN